MTDAITAQPPDIFGPVGSIIEINGLPGKWIKLACRHRYDRGKAGCPNCGGVGFCWAGWFSCDGGGDKSCFGHAWIETGEFIVPVQPGAEVGWAVTI